MQLKVHSVLSVFFSNGYYISFFFFLSLVERVSLQLINMRYIQELKMCRKFKGCCIQDVAYCKS